ncbi:MAG: hypothetical protein ACOC5D_02775 [Thermoplasmatota archaeon]
MSKNVKDTKRPPTHIAPLTNEEQVRVNDIYKRVQDMIDLRNQTWRYFNNRTLKQYIDDSEKRLNSYVPSKESQGKEEWQSNVALPTVRDKIKRIIAGYSLTVPELQVDARKNTGELDLASINRGEIASKLVKASYLESENPVIENFWEAWECAAKGTVIKYEGYVDNTITQKYIKSIDKETGKVEVDEREVDVEDRLISYLMPLEELYISDYHIHDIQDQDEIAWIKKYSKDKFEREFGDYHNAEKVKTSGQLVEDQESFYNEDKWKGRTQEDEIEVIRYYSKINDEYVVIANGVLLLDAPLLWKFNESKIYPFAKTILEPFSSKNFFYGKSFADIMMGQYDLLNTWFNTIMDKGFKSVNPPLMVGMVNKDMFDYEDMILDSRQKFYVDDVSQVSPMPIEKVSQADVAMIDILSQGIEESMPSLPELLRDKEATAREVVLTSERLQEMSVIYKENLVDLWRQKYQIRLSNIMTVYSNPKKIYKDGDVEEIYKTFVINDTIIDEESGDVGMLAIQFMDVPESEKGKMRRELEAEKEAMKSKGINYKKKIIKPDYFNSYEYQIHVSPKSLRRESQAKKQAMLIEELQLAAQFFPIVFQQNQENYLRRFAEAYEVDGEELVGAYRQAMEAQQKAQGAQGAQGAQEEPQEGQPQEGGEEMMQGLEQMLQQ